MNDNQDIRDGKEELGLFSYGTPITYKVLQYCLKVDLDVNMHSKL